MIAGQQGGMRGLSNGEIRHGPIGQSKKARTAEFSPTAAVIIVITTGVAT
jgi:hypothetical protein